jgi:SAM-dependent methyltransferase
VRREFDVAAEAEYYKKHPPSPWAEESNELVDTLMRFTAGDNWASFLCSRDVLEIGAGECTYLPRLLEKGRPARYVASDIFEDRFNAAREAIGATYSTLEFRTLRADHIDVDNESFDTVLAFGLFHHIPRLGAAFKEINRVLRLGGALIFRDPYVGNPLIWLKYSIIERSENEWPLGRSRTRRMLDLAGFDVERCSRFWLRFPNLPAGPWSTNVGFVAKKTVAIS